MKARTLFALAACSLLTACADTVDTPDVFDTAEQAAETPREADSATPAESAEPVQLDEIDREQRDRAAYATDRGIWMHYHSGSVYGLGQIVGNPGLEALALTRLQNWNIERVYGGYQNLPITERADVAGWNADLNAVGIDSQLLLGAPHHIFPGVDCRDSLLEQIQERLIDFHEGVGTVGGGLPMPLAAFERFDGLHLDLEPQAFKSGYYGTGGPPACAPTSEYWDVTTSRAQLLELLLDTYIEVRAFLDGHGYADFPIYVDLPVWIDTSTTIDWSDTPDFSSAGVWFVDVAAVVDGITFMSYERDNAADIRTSVIGERFMLLFSTDFRVSVNAKERVPFSSTLTWTSPTQLWSVVSDLQSGTGLYAYGVDIHNYRYLASPWFLSPAPSPWAPAFGFRGSRPDSGSNPRSDRPRRDR